jgi:hypothetical protein
MKKEEKQLRDYLASARSVKCLNAECGQENRKTGSELAMGTTCAFCGHPLPSAVNHEQLFRPPPKSIDEKITERARNRGPEKSR